MSMPLILRSPEPDTALQKCLTSAEQGGKIICHLLQPERLLATFVAKMQCWLMVHQDSWVLQSYFPASCPQHVLLHEAATPPQHQDFPSPFVKLHEVPVSPFLQPAQDTVSTALLSSILKTLN